MNNQELASLLIETANEILAEGANNKYVENARKEFAKGLEKINDEKKNNEITKLVNREKRRVEFGKDPTELKKLEEKQKKIFDDLNAKEAYLGNRYRDIKEKYSSNPGLVATIDGIRAKERFNEDFASPKSSSPAVARIYKRGKADEERVTKEHGLKNKVYNESIALLLMEAAELLSNDDIMLEAIARDTRKDVVKSVKDLKKEQEVKDFLNGNFSKKDGQKKYNEISKELDKLMELIQSMPKETPGEQVLAFIKSNLSITDGGFFRCLIIVIFGNTMAHFIGNTFASMLIWILNVSDFRTIRSKVEKNGETESNWNKAFAIKYITKLKDKIDYAYTKYYK